MSRLPQLRRSARAALVAALLLALGCEGFGPLAPRPLWEQPPAPAPDVDLVPEERLHRARLPNGAQVLVLEDSSLPWVEMGVTVRRGAGIEAPEEAGVAALTAEVMQRGAGPRTALELARVVEDLGASLRVGVDWDALHVGVAGLSRDRETLFEVLRDVTLRPRFDAGEVERARAELRASLRRAPQDPSTLASWRFAEAVYPGHRYGLPEGGTPETVAELDGEALRRFHARVFVPDNAIVFAVGDLDAEAFVEDVRGAFGGWPEGPVPEPAPPPRAPAERRIVVVDRPDLVQTQLRIGHEGIDRDDERRIPAQLVNTVLGSGGFTSRLMGRVRAEEGLTYGIGSSFVMRRRPGPFLVSTFTRNAEAARVVRIVLEELERLREEPMPAEELAAAKSLRAGSFALALETSSAVLDALVDLEVHDLPRDSLETYRARLRAVEAEQALEVARELLRPERATIVAVGPAETLVPLLEGLGSVEVVEP